MSTLNDNIKLPSRLIHAFDALILNASIITIVYTVVYGIDFLCSIIFLNNIAAIALRQCMMHVHGINWLTSPLNRCLKRTIDIIVSLAFLLTIFPIILLFFTIIIKTRHGGPVIILRKASVGDKHFNSICINVSSVDNRFTMRSPLAINILFGNISLWDITSITLITEESYITEPEVQHNLKEGFNDILTDDITTLCPNLDSENASQSSTDNQFTNDSTNQI